MFDPKNKPKMLVVEKASHNWEADIHDVKIEKCDEQVDPLGYHVVFYAREKKLADTVRHYVIGASHLSQRLAHLNRAGFEAPMTQKAIALLEKHLGASLQHA